MAFLLPSKVAASPPMVEAFLDLQGPQMEARQMAALPGVQKTEASLLETEEVHPYH